MPSEQNGATVERGLPSVVWFTHRMEDGTLVHNWPSNFYIEQDGTFVEAEFQAAKHEASW